MFYIKPPTGEVLMHNLENCVFNRLEYLDLLYRDKANEFDGNFEYLLENTVYDKIGHFTLRLLASISSDLLNYWIFREKLLFRTRLNYVSARELHRLFRSILYQIRSFENSQQLINKTLIDFCSLFLKPNVFKHLVSVNHKEDCNVFCSRVRFEFVPDLIQKRELDLDAGYAIVYCSKWKDALASLFYTYIITETVYIKAQALCTINQDVRLKYLYRKIQHHLFQSSIEGGRLTIKNIDKEAKYFPLCMQNLYKQLHSTHRLGHYARLHYSLFLKDSGMQIEDAINYWKREYSKPHSCSSKCSHDWQSSEKKFVYSIRHMYGLEGSRKNYRSPNCEFMCSSSFGPMYEGGCPFKNFDQNNLKSILKISVSEDEAINLINSTTRHKPETVCAEFFQILKTNNKDIVVNSPVQYYAMMINQV